MRKDPTVSPSKGPTDNKGEALVKVAKRLKTYKNEIQKGKKGAKIISKPDFRNYRKVGYPTNR